METIEPNRIRLKTPTYEPIGSPYGAKSKYWLWHLDEKGNWIKGQAKDDKGELFGNHKGTDFLTPLGTPIRACHDGFIIKAGYENIDNEKQGFGLRIIQMFQQNGKSFMIYYGHLSKIMEGFPNGKVAVGDLIGYSGNSGRSSGPHCHVEVRDLNQTSQPVEWV